MLENTFIHLPSVGQKTELKLWEEGIRTWDQFLDTCQNHAKFSRFIPEIFSSKVALHELNSTYFSSVIPSKETWRSWPHFAEKTVFLDIETTGLVPHHSEVTVVGLYDGKTTKTFVQGKNIDELPHALAPYKAVITFNGTMFDIPFLRAQVPEIQIPLLHIDLRFVLRSLGYKGGLKKIEKEFGFERDGDIAHLTGFDAVRLWRKYKKGDSGALETLIRYNSADIENLRLLMEFAYKMKKAALGFPR